MDRLADGPDGLREILDRMVRGHVARLEMHPSNPQIVAGNEPEQDFRQEAPLVRPEAAHDAEIDRDQAALAVHEQVSLVHVGMEEPVADRLPQKALDHGPPDGTGIVSSRDEVRGAVQLDAVDPFGGQDISRRQLPFGPGHAKILVALRVLSEFGGRRRFQPEIHFHQDGAGEDLHHLARTQALGLRREGVHHPRYEAHHLEVALEAVPHARPHHLHREGAARAVGILHHGPVNLRDGCAAIGSLNETKSDEIGLPNAASTTRIAVACGKGGTRS